MGENPYKLESMALDFDEYLQLVVATALLEPPRFPADGFVKRFRGFLRCSASMSSRIDSLVVFAVSS